jgi:hypothetical protein
VNGILFSLLMIFLSSMGILDFGLLSFGDAEIKGHSTTLTLDQSTYPIPTESRDLKISITISDPDFNKSPNGIDQIAQDLSEEPGVGPVKISINRGDKTILGYAGGISANNGKLDSSPLAESPAEKSQIRQFGPITETSPSSGVFKFDVSIKNIDGPESSKCPELGVIYKDRFDNSNEFSKHCILSGDVLLVEYTDPNDFSGNPRTISTSATFSVLSSSNSYGSSSDKIAATKTVRIGHPLTLLLYDSNLNLDGDKAETYSLDLIQFKSKNIRTTLGPKGGVQNEFNPMPAGLRETGKNTGIFYTVIEVPRTVNGKLVNVGEKIEFEYTQRGLGAFLAVHQGTFSPQLTHIPLNTVEQTEKKIFKVEPIEKICRPGFVKIFKYNDSPACVKPSTAEKLLERGWAKP